MDFEEYFNKLQETSSAQQAWSEKQADKQMGFQWAMSSSAHQREMEDLQKAGLNPVLAANAGAASGAGAMAQADSGLTSAMAGLMSKMIDVDMMNAAAALRSGVSGGSGGYSSSGSGELQDSLYDLGIEWLLNKLHINTRTKSGQKAVQTISDWTQNNLGDVISKGAELLGDAVSNAKAFFNGVKKNDSFSKSVESESEKPWIFPDSRGSHFVRKSSSDRKHGGTGGKF